MVDGESLLWRRRGIFTLPALPHPLPNTALTCQWLPNSYSHLRPLIWVPDPKSSCFLDISTWTSQGPLELSLFLLPQRAPLPGLPIHLAVQRRPLGTTIRFFSFLHNQSARANWSTSQLGPTGLPPRPLPQVTTSLQLASPHHLAQDSTVAHLDSLNPPDQCPWMPVCPFPTHFPS